ncbi:MULTISPECIES: hypothetical protein [unclassified Bacteroides]|uniref:hypothetical protein n=1 Tax=unclassified Bacteroides TaxID=2646097 RepID=UPI0004E27683|nr:MULTISPECIES: hypothetical protein [unclassified Bacteroides]
MREAILFIMLMCCGVVYPQHVEHIKEKHFEGYIFSKECSFCGFPPGDNRFTPSVEDVKKAEQMIHENADTIVGESRRFFLKRDAVKKRRLKKYKRQYWGEISPNGDYILCITFQCGLFDLAIERCEITTVLDGGTCFFELDIDMKRNKIIKIAINGVA